MSENRDHRVSSWKASAYGLHPTAFLLLIPTILFTILVGYEIFLLYLIVILAQVVLKYLDKDAKSFMRSILDAFFRSTKLTIRN